MARPEVRKNFQPQQEWGLGEKSISAWGRGLGPSQSPFLHSGIYPRICRIPDNPIGEKFPFSSSFPIKITKNLNLFYQLFLHLQIACTYNSTNNTSQDYAYIAINYFLQKRCETEEMKASKSLHSPRVSYRPWTLVWHPKEPYINASKQSFCCTKLGIVYVYGLELANSLPHFG